MPGNMIISNGGTMYNIVERKTSSTAAGYIYVSIITLIPNQYYQLGDVEQAYVTINAIDETAYNEYMFEVTFTGEAPLLRITTSMDMHWPREVAVKSGYKYQFSILNGVVLWTEVAV